MLALLRAPSQWSPAEDAGCFRRSTRKALCGSARETHAVGPVSLHCRARHGRQSRRAVLLLLHCCVVLAALLLAVASDHSVCGSQDARRRMQGAGTRARSADRTSCLCQTVVQCVCYSDRSYAITSLLVFLDNDISLSTYNNNTIYRYYSHLSVLDLFAPTEALNELLSGTTAGPGSLSVE